MAAPSAGTVGAGSTPANSAVVSQGARTTSVRVGGESSAMHVHVLRAAVDARELRGGRVGEGGGRSRGGDLFAAPSLAPNNSGRVGARLRGDGGNALGIWGGFLLDRYVRHFCGLKVSGGNWNAWVWSRRRVKVFSARVDCRE